MKYPSYLVHYNQNHSAKNGQFISGDGDGDGISNDHKNQKKTTARKTTAKKTTSKKKTTKKKTTTWNAFDDPFSLQNMQKYTARAEIFANSYRKYGFSKALDITEDHAVIDNFLQSLMR